MKLLWLTQIPEDYFRELGKSLGSTTCCRKSTCNSVLTHRYRLGTVFWV